MVGVEEVFHHCSKAFMRAALWDPAARDRTDLPSRAQIVKALEPAEETLAELEEYYGATYADRLYR